MEKRTHHPDNQDAIALLTADHQLVKKMFKDFKKLKEKGTSKEKATLVNQICRALEVHTQIEEEIFYPAVRAAIDDDDLMDEAAVEHQGAKELIEQLEAMKAAEDLYDAKVTVLGENIDHHVKEEQDEMFPKVKKSKLDLRALGKELAQRKAELEEEAGTPSDSTKNKKSVSKAATSQKAATHRR